MFSIRKRQNGTKAAELTLDDIKGTGGKPQNADCIILVQRTPDRKQVKLQSFSKDSDINIRVLLNVSPKGSTEAKFTYAGDLEKTAADMKAKGAENRAKVEAALTTVRQSTSEIGNAVGLKPDTVRKHLLALAGEKKADFFGEGRNRFWVKKQGDALR